jgi:aldehyde:ferredoxin oxidoreductase
VKGKVDRLKAERGRGLIVKESEDVNAIIDSLIICKNAKGTLYKELADMARLYNLVTGIDMTPDQLRAAGERIINIARLINLREGLTRKDDTLPWKVMNQPIQDDGPVKGAVVPQEELDLLLDDYYTVRGWNVDGVPTKGKLKELAMDEYQNLL